MFGRKPRENRRRLNATAWIAEAGDFGLRPCTVIDISPGGARLSVNDASQLAKRFTLTFERATRRGRTCEIRWQRGKLIGVRFIA